MDNKTFYEKQISLSEWFENTKHKLTEKFREEDNEKRERLNLLSKLIDLPYDKPVQFKATDLAQKTERLNKFVKERGNEFCALRLIPTDPKLPKLRMRGITIKEAVKWFENQKIDPKNYRAEFIPHSENPIWSTIFVINQKGIFGEIISGMHNQLTQGFYEKAKPISFLHDFNQLKLEKPNFKAKKHLNEVLKKIKITDSNTKNKIQKHLKNKFIEDYLAGYWETISTQEYGLWFIDYNRILGEMYNNFSFAFGHTRNSKQLKGKAGSLGKATGKVKIVDDSNLSKIRLEKNTILVCDMTSPDYVSLMRKSSAIVTNKGGILSHAAIIAREFQIPCIVATDNATEILQNGDLVEVDADRGIVKILK